MESMKKMINRIMGINRGRRTVLVLFDVLFFALSCVICRLFYTVTLWTVHSGAFLCWAAVPFALIFAARMVFGAYNNVWRYSTAGAYLYLVIADSCGSFAALIIAVAMGNSAQTWQLAVVGAFDLLLALASRFAYSILYKRSTQYELPQHRSAVAVIGAGHIGSYLADDLKRNPSSEYEPVFFIDKDIAKVGKYIGGIPIYSVEEGAKRIHAEQIETVIVTIASDDSDFLMGLYNHYARLGCKVKLCDALVKDNEPSPHMGKIREFKIEDILFRKPIDLENASSRRFYSDKTVLITGGGGSIGSELCRQVARCAPRKLVVFDIYENNAYEIEQELRMLYGNNLELSVEIGSVRDAARLDEVFDRYRPNVVFHAAAHKHVPLMEHCGAEAVKNNVLGTYYTANAAEKYGVEKFILISTDKAVNPTNIMGASKRVCEMIVQSRNQSVTSFAAVRFGNVLGSNGSVVPLFRRQIEEGGPVTITDKRIIRYFMTIPEASQLVLQAGAMAHSGELFVLDMGKPVRIYDLAVSMIRLSGLEPDKDIEIREIGLRPGEKLYEELLMKSETLDKTENDLIYIERDARCTREQIERKINLLVRAADENGDMHAAFRSVVPTYRPPEEVNDCANESDEMKTVATIA